MKVFDAIYNSDIVCYNLARLRNLLGHGSFVRGMERKLWGSLHTPGFVKHAFRAMSRVGMVESTQGIILLGKMWRHVTFGNVYWEFDSVQT